MKKFLITLFLCTICGASLAAQICEKVYSRDGNLYEGYISTQVPGVKVEVTTFRTTIVVPAEQVLSVKGERDVTVDALPSVLGEYFSGMPSSFKVKVADVKTETRTFSASVILEQGANYRILAKVDTLVEVSWKDLLVIAKDPVPMDAKTGVRDILTLKSGDVSYGTLIEQNIQKGMIKFWSNGEASQYRMSEIKTLQFMPAGSMSLSSQAPLMDVLVLKDGTAPLRGFITSREPGKEVKIFSDGQEKSVSTKEIAAYKKVKNQAYLAAGKQVRKTVADGELLVNGKKTETFPLTSGDKFVCEFTEDGPRPVEIQKGVGYDFWWGITCRTSQIKIFRSQNKKINPVFDLSGPKADVADINFVQCADGIVKMNIVFFEPGTYAICGKEGYDKCILVTVNE